MKLSDARNDFQLLDCLRGEGWDVIGSGFKQETTYTAKDINIGLWRRVKDETKAVAFPCINDKEMYWVATKD